jgi:hypothetical protein
MKLLHQYNKHGTYDMKDIILSEKKIKTCA